MNTHNEQDQSGMASLLDDREWCERCGLVILIDFDQLRFSADGAVRCGPCDDAWHQDQVNFYTAKWLLEAADVWDAVEATKWWQLVRRATLRHRAYRYEHNAESWRRSRYDDEAF